MPEIEVCRICLNDNSRMFVITNTILQDLWEKLTNTNFITNDGKPVLACYLCCAQLRRCFNIMKIALKSEELLTNLINSGLTISQKRLSLIDRQGCYKLQHSCVTSLYIGESVEDVKQLNSIKRETEEEQKTDIKEENDYPDSNHGGSLDIDNVQSATDSDDNVPLKSICSKKKVKTKVNKSREKKPKKIILKRIDKSKKLDVVEIVLSKNEQMEELLKRTKTENYICSPYKCRMCYKGFVDTRAYENHKEKHSDRCGDHECDICHMRYKTERHLKTHLYSVHERRYKCNKCSFISHTPNQAKEHEKWHDGYTYECKLCGQKFRKSTSYLTHMRTRHPTGNVCNICGESFVGKLGLMLHKTKMHRLDIEKTENTEESPTDRFCVECNMQFSTLDAWKRHILSSMKHMLANENGTQCKICDQSVTKGNLTAHMKEHDKNMRRAQTVAVSEVKLAPLACNQCGAKFINGSKLRSHVRRMHLGLKYNKNIVCEVCGKKCTSNATLVYHQRSHTGERPYECNVCNKRFRDTNQLRIHVRTHTGERPYCCNHCGKRFCQKPALNRHYRVHTGVKPYECQYCSKAFSQSNSLKGHIKTVHLKMPANNKRRVQKNPNTVQEEEKQELPEIVHDGI